MNGGNTLELNVERIGTLYDGDSRTPEIQASVKRTDKGIQIELAWSAFDSPFGRWFNDGAIYEDDPDRKNYAYEVPTQLWFSDSKGKIALLGCRGISKTSNLSSGTNALIYADHAVLDASLCKDYSTIDKMRSSITGLHDWVGGTSLTNSSERDQEGRLTSASYVFSVRPTVPLDKAGSVNLLYYWFSESHGDIIELHDSLLLESQSEKPVKWKDLERDQRLVRDLLSISTWEYLDLRIQTVQRVDDPRLLMNGTPFGERWCSVVDGGGENSNPLRRNHLIQFSDLPSEWFDEWSAVYEEYSRAFDPIISSLKLINATIEVQIEDVGIGLEALGYYLFISDGESKSKANKHSFHDRLTRISQDLGEDFPIDLKAWATNMADAYNATKHVNRVPLQLLDNANAWRESVLVFRSWVALRLGIPKGKLLSSIKSDRLSRPYNRTRVRG